MFIAGTSASDVHFQAYLLDGLMRWNADRAIAGVSSTESGPETYSGILTQAVNELSEDVLGKKMKSNFQNIGIYTGELIGVEYLYNQTGEILKDNTLEDEDVRPPGEEPLSDINPNQIDEGFDEDEDETIAQAEQVFSVPLTNDRGKCTFSSKSILPKSSTNTVNFHLDSEANSTSDEDSNGEVGNALPCDSEVSFY